MMRKAKRGQAGSKQVIVGLILILFLVLILIIVIRPKMLDGTRNTIAAILDAAGISKFLPGQVQAQPPGDPRPGYVSLMKIQDSGGVPLLAYSAADMPNDPRGTHISSPPPIVHLPLHFTFNSKVSLPLPGKPATNVLKFKLRYIRNVAANFPSQGPNSATAGGWLDTMWCQPGDPSLDALNQFGSGEKITTDYNLALDAKNLPENGQTDRIQLQSRIANAHGELGFSTGGDPLTYYSFRKEHGVLNVMFSDDDTFHEDSSGWYNLNDWNNWGSNMRKNAVNCDLDSSNTAVDIKGPLAGPGYYRLDILTMDNPTMPFNDEASVIYFQLAP